MNDDAALLRRYAEEKSEAAFAELVRRHLDLVYSAAQRRLGGDAHRAADVAQVVFMALAREAGRLARHTVLTAWLYTATRNAAVDTIRAAQRRRSREHEAHLMHTLNSSPVPSEADWAQLRPVLDAAMDELAESDRAAVLLRFFEQRPFAEVGAALRLSEDGARMRVERALGKLRTGLARRGVTSTAAALGAVLSSQTVLAAPTGLAATVSSGVASLGAVTPWAEIMQFMANTKLKLGIAGLVVAASIGLVTHDVAVRRAAQEAALAAERDYRAQLARTRDLVLRAQTAEQESARLAKLVEEARAKAAANSGEGHGAGAAGKAPPAPNPLAEGKLFLARHPEVNRALIEWAEAIVGAQWGPFIRRRGFTPAQAEEFRLLTRARSLIPAPGPDGKELQLYSGAYLSAQETDRRLHTLLGEEGWGQYEEFARSLPARGFTDRMAGALAFSDTPLAPEQAQQLTRILERNRSAGVGTRFDWDAVLTDSRAVLTVAQQAVLGGMRAEDQLQRAMDRAGTAPAK